MEIVAILYLVLTGILLVVPGSAYLNKPKLDWGSPNVYLSIITFGLATALAIWTLV